MSSRVENALENHGKGYNCCQAVACAYADLAGVDENLIFAAGEGFGAGMGGMQCTCGAVSGACMVAGLLKSSRNTEEPVTKGGTYRITKEIAQAFKDKNGSVICKDLKDVKDYFDEEGVDLEGQSKEDILDAPEVFDVGDGRYLIVES